MSLGVVFVEFKKSLSRSQDPEQNHSRSSASEVGPGSRQQRESGCTLSALCEIRFLLRIR
jgi:hypothetical protein